MSRIISNEKKGLGNDGMHHQRSAAVEKTHSAYIQYINILGIYHQNEERVIVSI